MTTLEAIKAVRAAVEDAAWTDSDESTFEAIRAAEAEAKREQEEFERAREAWNNSMEWLGDDAEDQTVELAAQQWDYDTLVAYFNPAKEG
jgi:hypothetical protein